MPSKNGSDFKVETTLTEKTGSTLPDALLLMGRQCPYCPAVLKGLQALKAAGDIGQLETVVIEDHPQRAIELGVRSVPWVRIGTYELPGLRSEQELREWALKAGSETGMANYLDELLSGGELLKAQELIRKDPGAMHTLLELLSDPDIQLNTRIGISAIMEEFAGSEQLQGIVGQLGTLTKHKEANIRGDACHFLALSGSNEAIDYIRPLLDDPDANVREIARDSFEQLSD